MPAFTKKIFPTRSEIIQNAADSPYIPTTPCSTPELMSNINPHESPLSRNDSTHSSPAPTPEAEESTQATQCRTQDVSKKKSKRKLDVKSLRRLNPTLVLENAGSVARDHLASERTFLAYVRTSIAIASTGVALVQLFTIADLTSRSTGIPLSSTSRKVQQFARPLGITCVLFALLTLGIGMHRYFLVQVALPKNKFPVARSSIAFIAFVLSAIVVVIFGALLSGRSGS